MLISKGGSYLQSGHFWQRLMVVPRLAGEAANGAVVDRGPFRLGRFLLWFVYVWATR